MSQTRSLSFLMSAWMAVAIAAAMGIYGVFQYLVSPTTSASELLLNHLWHVIVLAGVIYGLSWIVFRRAVAQPLERIYAHLYGIGTGRLGELKLDTNVTEIHTIVEGINVMLRRMMQGPGGQAAKHAQEQTAALRDLAKKLAPEHREVAMGILDRLAEIDKSVLSLAQNSADRAVLKFS